MNVPEEIKVVLLGDSGVGKTSIISQFITNKFDQLCEPSLNSQFASKTLEYAEYDKSLKFNIWDTVGQERYRALAKIFYRDADVIIFVYDITSILSFEAIKNYWYIEAQKDASKNPILALVANKSDLDKNEKITYNEGRNFAKEIKAIFAQTSAISNLGINELFQIIGEKIIDPEYEINYNFNEIDTEFYYKKLKEINELKSIKSNRTNRTNKTNKTNNTNRTKITNKSNKTNKTNKTIKLEVIKEKEEDKKVEKRRKKCCH